MLAALARGLEERDRIHGHGARVAELAEPVARRLGWGPERIAILRQAAPLHDVGKVIVRAEVLLKQGPLSGSERDEVRLHPRAGASLVLPLTDAHHLLPYVLLHHERWDGAGYPCELRGTAIPSEARLLAVADAFDAMTSTRPYRAALTREVAFAEVESGAGTQFDPGIAELFCTIWASA
jgi:HD-GYP domain-containing protein (c-di-GMP phosphodiesterase class II)